MKRIRNLRRSDHELWTHLTLRTVPEMPTPMSVNTYNRERVSTTTVGSFIDVGNAICRNRSLSGMEHTLLSTSFEDFFRANSAQFITIRRIGSFELEKESVFSRLLIFSFMIVFFYSKCLFLWGFWKLNPINKIFAPSSFEFRQIIHKWTILWITFSGV
jgi:hypothetical protein